MRFWRDKWNRTYISRSRNFFLPQRKSRAAGLFGVLARKPIELIPSLRTRLALVKWGTIVVGTRVHSRNARDAKIATNSYSCCTHLLALHYGSVYFIVITLKTAELADTWLESLIGTACSEDKHNKGVAAETIPFGVANLQLFMPHLITLQSHITESTKESFFKLEKKRKSLNPSEMHQHYSWQFFVSMAN